MSSIEVALTALSRQYALDIWSLAHDRLSIRGELWSWSPWRLIILTKAHITNSRLSVALAKTVALMITPHTHTTWSHSGSKDGGNGRIRPTAFFFPQTVNILAPRMQLFSTCNQAVKKDARGLPESFSKRLLFDNRWRFIVGFVFIQAVVWHCSCILGCVKCACGFGAQMLWAAIKGMAQTYLFNMDPRKLLSLTISDERWYTICTMVGWLRCTVVRTFAFDLSHGWLLMWVNHPLHVSQLGQLSLSSFRGR